MSDGTNVKLSFESLVPYGDWLVNASYYDGYQGFNFKEMELGTRLWIDDMGLQDSGFGSVLHGDAEALTAGVGGGSPAATYGYLVSSYAGETFNLKSGIFASGRYPTLSVAFLSFEANGHQKAQVQMQLTETATTINFANYGRDFRNIATVEIISTGSGGGGGSYNVAMDNLRVHWNGPIPGSGAMKHHTHVSHPVLAAMAGQNHHASNLSSGGDSGANSSTDGHHHPDYHGALASLVSLAHHGGGLTSEFSLPQADHFGT